MFALWPSLVFAPLAIADAATYVIARRRIPRPWWWFVPGSGFVLLAQRWRRQHA